MSRVPNRIENPSLATLIAGAGFVSLERFAEAVNHRGWDMHGVKTNYDHISVKRWLAGGRCLNPDVVAAVLSEAWGIQVPQEVIWPTLREGRPPLPPHLHPWVAERTLEELGVFLRSDMLSRRETLTTAITVVPGPTLLAPIARWLGAPPGRLAASDEGIPRVGMADVQALEHSARSFAATDANAGGELNREAAVGQLKYAVDLARHGSYSERVGNRLLAAIAELSGLVGWMCHDSKMPGPAQRYFMYGLQAARESADQRAPLLVVSILADMAEHTRWLGQPYTAFRLHDLAMSQLPADRRRFNVLRAVLSAKRAENGLCHLGPSCLPDVQSALSLSFDLYAQASDEDKATAAAVWYRSLDVSEAELHVSAAVAYVVMARDDPRLTAKAEKHTFGHLANVPNDQGRSKTFGQIRLAKIRFLTGEAEQACNDGDQALNAAELVRSATIRTRLRELLTDSEAYAGLPRVAEFRERLRLTLLSETAVRARRERL